jgi:hypothetical protein
MDARTENESLLSRYFLLQLIVVFLVAATGFILLRSSDYTAVDGALRALEVYQKNRPFLHPNNHLLYPVNLYIWGWLLSGLGIRASNPVSFLAIAQAMNAIAAAGCLTILYGIVYKLSKRVMVAGLAAGTFGLSRAFVAHATNSAEPMVGVLWSLAAMALLLYGLSRRRYWPLAGAGVLLALALATYQVMVLLGAPMLFLLCRYSGREAQRPSPASRLLSAGCFFAGFGAGVPLVYGIAYYLSGTRTVVAMATRFFGTGVAGIKTTLNLFRLLPGFALALFPCLPPECGFRCLTLPQYRPWIPIAAGAVLIAGSWLFVTLILVRRIWPRAEENERMAMVACGIGLIATLIPSLIWISAYDKFWLQPLACFFVGAAIVWHAACRAADRPWGRPRLRLAGVSAVLALLMASNLAATWRSARPKPYVAQAQEVAALVGPQDLLVGDWNDAFLHYQAFWAERANNFNVPTKALWDGAASIQQMQRAIESAKSSGGKIYFLGILDISESDWRTYYLGEPLNAPYSAFAEYRRCARTLKSFPAERRPVTLRQYGPCANQPAPMSGPVPAARRQFSLPVLNSAVESGSR